MFATMAAYLRTAFTNRWNLLLFGGGVAAAFVAGLPGVILPLVLAGEVYYLASLTANQRFRAAVDAQRATSRRAAGTADAQQAYATIRQQLPAPLVRRFDRLRDHCLKLVEIAGSLQGPNDAGADRGSVESLDRLLWGYLRMIWGAARLGEFLDHTDESSIQERIAELEKRLVALPPAAESVDGGQLRAALEDHLRTSRERLGNIQDARRKLDLLGAEVERLESKIAALAEAAVAKRDVHDIARRVDEVAEGIRATDETMRQFQLPPALEDLETPPPLLGEQA